MFYKDLNNSCIVHTRHSSQTSASGIYIIFQSKNKSLFLLSNDFDYIYLITRLKLAKVFDVSVDFELSVYDKEVLKKINDIEKLDRDTKKHLFFLIDNVLQNFKTKKTFA